MKVTLARHVELEFPLVAEGERILEPGSDVVWFTFPGLWHDIGRFHARDGSLTGIYANLITPCLFEPGGVWHTTDLFLDLWIPAVGGVPAPDRATILDVEELRRAEASGELDPFLVRRARDEADRLRSETGTGAWPPPVVDEWTLRRAVEVATSG